MQIDQCDDRLSFLFKFKQNKIAITANFVYYKKSKNIKTQYSHTWVKISLLNLLTQQSF